MIKECHNSDSIWPRQRHPDRVPSPSMSEAVDTSARIAEVREQLTLLRDYL